VLPTLPEVPPPVLFNAWKHHAGFLRERIREAALGGPAGVRALADRLVVVGTKLMDHYTGALSPAEVADRVVAGLREDALLEADAFRAWVAAGGGYRVVPLPDGSQWVLRHGEEGERYVHVHPARWAPRTLRVRANVLKTAVVALAHAGQVGGDALDVKLLNDVRARYLGLSPVGRLREGDQGIGEVLELLRTGP
jgi:hypothetical protein